MTMNFELSELFGYGAALVTVAGAAFWTKKTVENHNEQLKTLGNLISEINVDIEKLKVFTDLFKHCSERLEKLEERMISFEKSDFLQTPIADKRYVTNKELDLVLKNISISQQVIKDDLKKLETTISSLDTKIDKILTSIKL